MHQEPLATTLFMARSSTWKEVLNCFMFFAISFVVLFPSLAFIHCSKCYQEVASHILHTRLSLNRCPRSCPSSCSTGPLGAPTETSSSMNKVKHPFWPGARRYHTRVLHNAISYDSRCVFRPLCTHLLQIRYLKSALWIGQLNLLKIIDLIGDQ